MEEIDGYIEDIIFLSPDNGFTVAKLKEPHKDKLTVITGYLSIAQPGETITCKGSWKYHPKHGEQFEVSSFEVESPADLVGIQKYLESGLIKGIGPSYAKKIVDKFGEETLNILDKTPQRLLEITGIGAKRIDKIIECWQEQSSIRQVMIFLRSQGISPVYAQKIYKTYGDQSIQKVKENPYQLAKDIFGIGFKMADKTAQNMGFALNSDQRIEAGIEYVLFELTNEGHTRYPKDQLLEKVQQTLEVEIQLIEKVLHQMIDEKKLIFDGSFIWLRTFYYSELGAAKELLRLYTSPINVRSIDIEKAIIWAQKELNIEFAHEQIQAVKGCLENKLHIVTGGPGTGKSTITNAILRIYEKLTNKILLTAPTGRAAKRLSQITRKKAFTIHAALEFDPATKNFKKTQENPLSHDLIIVDEASMIDTYIMFLFLRAIPDHAKVIFIGDIDQLPSVGAGNVLKDLIGSEKIPVTTLKEIFRQAKGSKIIVNAHRINEGEFPYLTQAKWSDFHFYEVNEPEEIQAKIIEMVSDKIPKMKNFDPIKDIQVLAPMKKGLIGIEMLNNYLQCKLNPSNNPFYKGGKRFHLNDKVMQIKNNYQKKVYNGDVGTIITIDLSEQTLYVGFEEKIVEYDFSELDELVLAYAVSVHKYQGSECPCIVMPIHTSHFKLLHRNLLYTAITRGKRLVVLIGTKKAIAIAINNNEVQLRHTGLKDLLKKEDFQETTLPGLSF